jgi:flagellar protein FlgJ
MSDPIRALGAPAVPIAGTAAAKPGEDAKLRKVARQMEGVFVQELYKAMRATVPQNEGAVEAGAGEELFTGLMDQHLSTETPEAWGRGLGEAIYQHLRGQVGAASGSPTPSAAPMKAGSLAAPAPLPLRDASPPLALHDAPTPLLSSLDAGR